MIKSPTGVLAIVLLCAGCGSDPHAGPATPAPAASATASPTAAPSAAGQTPAKAVDGKETRVASAKLIDRRERTALAADTLDVQAKSAKVPKTSAEIYRAVAPATVIIRVEGGLGSGVIIDPAGWLLTNHHVIAEGKGEDFKHHATVMLGALSAESGAMERADKEYDAEVYKADKLRDIALLKITDPPAALPAVKVSARKPLPGEDVIALGHAGAGMLWALKSGQISALGKLADHLATLAAFADDAEGHKARAAFQKVVESKNLGVVIQSTCNILPGDSGGPLVNNQGELVGLNVFSRRDGRTGGLLSFHVHLGEIQAFLKERPTKPAQLLPDPWMEGGGDLSWEDADLDGRVDVLVMQGRQPCHVCPRESAAAFIDADQDSYAGRADLPDLNDVFDKRDFDAEAVFLQLGGNVLIWYDSDNDGRFDRLLYDEGITGRVSAGYVIAADGSLERSDELSVGKPLRPALFQDAALHERFTRIARAAFPDNYTDAPEKLGDAVPLAIGKTGRANAVDLNEDGLPDAADVSTPFTKRLLIDADQRFVGRTGPSFNLADVDPAALDPEVSIVSQGQHMWVLYDTDDDQRFDLVLHSPGARVYVAAEAFRIDASGAKTVATAELGRKLVRPGLLASKPQAQAVASMVQRGLLALMSASDEGLGSFPDPVADHRGAGYELLDLTGLPRATVTVMAQGSDGYLIDLDRNSPLSGPADKLDLGKILADGKLDAEFAFFHRNGIAWAYYDTDARKGYDVLLVATDPSSGKSSAAFRIDAMGVAKLDPTLVGKEIIRPSLLGGALRQRMQQAAADLFADTLIEK